MTNRHDPVCRVGPWWLFDEDVVTPNSHSWFPLSKALLVTDIGEQMMFVEEVVTQNCLELG